MNNRSFHTCSIILFFFLSIFISSFALAQKTDVIILFNGDKITGEIKELQTGLLKLSTNNLSTVYIEWDKIIELRTDKFFEVELTDGRIYFGSFQPSKREGTIILKGVTLENEFYLKYIVRITRIRESFWDILDGYVKLGISFNKANKVGEINFGLDAIYTTKSQRSELILNSDFSSSEGNPTSKNNNATFIFNKFLEHKWFWDATSIVEQNSELGLDLRATLGAAAGNDFIQTNKHFFNAIAGIAVSKEWYEGESEGQYYLMGYFSSRYQYFIYESPGISIYSFLNIYPYISDLGRIRINYTLDFDWELIKDFYWNLSFYMDYDNQPQSSDASTVDYSIETGIKYNL